MLFKKISDKRRNIIMHITAQKNPENTTWEHRIDFTTKDGRKIQKRRNGFKTKREALNAGHKFATTRLHY